MVSPVLGRLGLWEWIIYPIQGKCAITFDVWVLENFFLCKWAPIFWLAKLGCTVLSSTLQRCSTQCVYKAKLQCPIVSSCFNCTLCLNSCSRLWKRASVNASWFQKMVLHQRECLEFSVTTSYELRIGYIIWDLVFDCFLIPRNPRNHKPTVITKLQ